MNSNNENLIVDFHFAIHLSFICSVYNLEFAFRSATFLQQCTKCILYDNNHTRQHIGTTQCIEIRGRHMDLYFVC